MADLTDAEQASLLKTLIKLIRSLQLRNAIPPQRMCVTCKYFRPNAHPEGAEPHHCAFVDAPFGNRALRLDCGEHEQAGAPETARNWNAFTIPARARRSGHDIFQRDDCGGARVIRFHAIGSYSPPPGGERGTRREEGAASPRQTGRSGSQASRPFYKQRRIPCQE
ncbi:MAG: hypothetical protein WBW81_10175 [Methylocella sp.]